MDLKISKRQKNFTYIDLFSGAGGLSLGLGWAGLHGLFALEKCAMAFETFSKNLIDKSSPYSHFNKWPAWVPQTNHYVDKLLENKEFVSNVKALRGTVDLVAGGPPCQGFSVGGRRDGSDPRNQLVYNFLDFVELVKPKFVLIENVLGIARKFEAKPGEVEEGSVADKIVVELNSMGYQATWIKVNAANFGVPQTRERVLIFGVSKKLITGKIDLKTKVESLFVEVAKKQLKELGLSLTERVTVYDAIHDLASKPQLPCPDSPKYLTSKYLSARSVYANLMRRNINDGEVPNSHRFSVHGDKVLALYQKAHDTQKPGRLSKEFLLQNNTKTDKKVLLDPSLPSTTLTTHPDEQIHYKFPRNVTLREMARFQSFPDDFKFYGRYTLNGPRRKLDVSRCAQIGNAVPPLLARAIGQVFFELDKYLENVRPKTQARAENSLTV